MIRKAKNSDLKKIKKIIFDCARILKWSRKDVNRLRKIYTLKKFSKYLFSSDFFVYSLKKKIIGSGRLEKDVIWTLYIDPLYHQRGIGTKILKHLLFLAKKKGIKKVRLYALDTAIGFYKKNGFRLIKKSSNLMTRKI